MTTPGSTMHRIGHIRPAMRTGRHGGIPFPGRSLRGGPNLQCARCSVAVFPFAAVAARARVVARPAGIFQGVGRHEFRWRTVLAQEFDHGMRGLSDVAEERLVARAEVVLTRLAVRGGHEAVLGTAAVADDPDAVSYTH